MRLKIEDLESSRDLNARLYDDLKLEYDKKVEEMSRLKIQFDYDVRQLKTQIDELNELIKKMALGFTEVEKQLEMKSVECELLRKENEELTKKWNDACTNLESEASKKKVESVKDSGKVGHIYAEHSFGLAFEYFIKAKNANKDLDFLEKCMDKFCKDLESRVKFMWSNYERKGSEPSWSYNDIVAAQAFVDKVKCFMKKLDAAISLANTGERMKLEALDLPFECGNFPKLIEEIFGTPVASSKVLSS